MSLSKVHRKNEDCEVINILAENFDGEEGNYPHGFNGDGVNALSAGDRRPVSFDKNTDAYGQGKKAGLEEAEKQFGATVKALAEAIDEIGRLRQLILKNSTDDMVRLVMAVSEQLVQSEISVRDDAIIAVINNALQAAVKSDEFHIKVNPADFEMVTKNRPLFLASISGLKNITFEADQKTSRGGCLVESVLGEVDATLETRLDEIRQHLTGLMEKRNATAG